jgi:hypothetical protein
MKLKARIKRTKNLSARVLKDAVAVAYGQYRMNAPYAKGYGFDPNKDGTEVSSGEFVADIHDAHNRFDGVLDYEEFTITDTKSGEVRTFATTGND